ncbi:hypothetical protein BDY21DRAFT_335535 [Lineolata rhizophorae]|uniref:Secreted protein n=1 Tax=Lineolata rhizophorae TaxID=578093 RepID=A0A6A6P911_9PEZI|nr:hypothetical protein BDY21DRAFT_335535 [Lineolata rhizophorae]
MGCVGSCARCVCAVWFVGRTRGVRTVCLVGLGCVGRRRGGRRRQRRRRMAMRKGSMGVGGFKEEWYVVGEAPSRVLPARMTDAARRK